ncbi:MAG: hypothetical protein J6P60_01015, partial [Lachnospiraceae bacterium]|nr:hypothetical protein [Lachnospiraceae bacterium]
IWEDEMDNTVAASLWNKVKGMLYLTSLVILLGMFLYVFACAFLECGSIPFAAECFAPALTGFLMLLGLLTIALFFALADRITKKCGDQTLSVVMAVLFCLLIAVQLLFLFGMKIRLRYDALKVLDEAISLCKTGKVSPDHLDGYFARYTNNYPILLLTATILRAGRFVGIVGADFSGATELLGLVNLVAVDAAVLVVTRSAKRMFGLRSACRILLCIVINPLFVIWVPFYYTNTLAMPFLALILDLMYRGIFDKKRSRVGSLVTCFALGVCLAAGIGLRATTLLACMAGVLYLVLSTCNWEDQENMTDKKSRLVRAGCSVAGLAAGILLALTIYQTAQQRYIDFDYTDTAFPAIHWINMGAGGTGEYNILDEQLTMSYPTREQKREANMESFRARTSELGVAGYASLMLRKLKLTFADAGAGYRSELGVSDRYNEANLYLVGGKSDGIGFLIQINYVYCLLCMIALTVSLFMRDLREKKTVSAVTFLWTIAGAFCFHMIWEAGTIYSLSFAILFPFAAGIRMPQEKRPGAIWEALSGQKPKRVFAACYLIACVALAWMLYPKFVKDTVVTNDAVVNQYIYEWGDTDELLADEEWKQTFYVNRPFNHLSFQVRNLMGESNDAVYEITLLDPQDRPLQTDRIRAGDYGDYDFVRLVVEGMEELKNPDIYTVRILKISGEADQNLVFLSYKTGNYDAYSPGRLINGQQLQDLCFSAYETKEEPYMTVLGFVICSMISLAVAVVIQICLLRFPAEDPIR